MKEAYVSFEVAKLLKEKGFPQSTSICNTVYKPNGKMSFNAKSFINPYYIFKNCYIFAPTQQMAMCWLREEKGIHISADIYKDSSNDADGNVVDEWTYWAWTFYWLPSGNVGDEEGYDQFDSYEDAVEAGLEFVLKNLI